MITTISILVLICALILLVRVAALAWDAAYDMLTRPFNPRYMTTWATTLALSLIVMGALGYLMYFCCLTLSNNPY